MPVSSALSSAVPGASMVKSSWFVPRGTWGADLSVFLQIGSAPSDKRILRPLAPGWKRGDTAFASSVGQDLSKPTADKEAHEKGDLGGRLIT